MLPHPLKRPGEDRGPAARSLTDEAPADADKTGSRQAAPAGTGGRSSGRSPADGARINPPGRRSPAGLGDKPLSPWELCSSGSPRRGLWRSGDVPLKSCPPARRVPRPPEGGVPAKPGAAARRAAREMPPPPAPRPLPATQRSSGAPLQTRGAKGGFRRHGQQGGAGSAQPSAARGCCPAPACFKNTCQILPRGSLSPSFSPPPPPRHQRKTRFPLSR